MGFGMCVPDNAVSVLYLCCPRSFRLSFCSHFADRKHHAVQRCFLFLQLYRGQFLCCPSTVYSTCYLLFFAAKLRKDRIQRKEYIVVIIEAPEKWKPQILLGISGRSFPQTACGKFPEKWKAFSTREKWKVCGVENKSLWKKSWKTCRTQNTASTSCGKHIPQLSTTDSTSPLLQLSNAADTAGTFSAHGFSTDC